MLLFATTYFPDVFNKDWCEFHKEVVEEMMSLVFANNLRKQYYCRAAPRGHGKSQILSFLLPLWCICYEYKQNILIVSDTLPQAKQFITDIRTQLEDNELLREDFGDLIGMTIWSQDKIVTANKIHICGKGAAQKLRGIKYNNIRPDLIIIDDLENDESVETERQRTKLKNWFLKALIPCGQANTTYIYIGTVLHYDALLYNILTEKNFAYWNRKIYQAIYKFSNSPLWDDWEEIVQDITLDNPAEEAFKFYESHREEMLDGVEILWPDYSPDHYYELMLIKSANLDSFLSEYQNEPINALNAEFDITNIKYYDSININELEIFGAVDPSMGKNNRSDRSAIIWLGRAKDNYLYVLEIDARRRPPDKIIDDIIAGLIKYSPKKFSCEEIAFQAFFAQELRKRTVNAGLYVDFEATKPISDKDLRIRSLIPKFKNGYIHIKRDMQNLVNEMARFPKGQSDDILDALESAVAMAMPNVANQFCFGSLSYAKNR